MKTQFHLLYIAGSVAAALIAGIGIVIHAPFVYGVIPGIIGGLFAGMAAVQFFRNREDLAGFIATTCGFVFYQAFQANPVILPEFTAYIAVIPEQDQLVGIVLSNLTTAMLLVSYHAVSKLFGRTIDRWLPKPAATTRKRCDGLMLIGFSLLFVIVALPNILFGKVIVGPIQTIIYQRAAWSLSLIHIYGARPVKQKAKCANIERSFRPIHEEAAVKRNNNPLATQACPTQEQRNRVPDK